MLYSAVYFLSLPERLLRALAAAVGGLIYETLELIVPAALKRTRLYQALVARTLRLVLELAGGVKRPGPAPDLSAPELAVRKAAGNVVELASLLTMGWSPLWLLAAAADLTGGTRLYLSAFVAELKRRGLLPPEAEFASVEDVLRTLEGTSGVMADLVDLPPLNAADLRRSWQMLRQHVGDLPEPGRLAELYARIQGLAQQQDRSPLDVSAVLGLSAVRAGLRLGQTQLFDYYADTLRTIGAEGWAAFARRVARPYLVVAASHLNPRRPSTTERLLRRRRPGAAGKPGPPPPSGG
jgi:hypothetical protein